MNLDNVFGIAGTALNAQTIRMNTTASNLANANSVSAQKPMLTAANAPCSKP